MSNNRITDMGIMSDFPYPVASAWHRAFVATYELDRLKHLLVAYDILLRLLASVLIVDYLRGERSERVEELLEKLSRPSLGHWLGLIREICRVLQRRSEPSPFFDEAGGWFFDEHGKQTEVGRRLDELVTARNREAHDTPALSERSGSERARHVLNELRFVCASLGWLARYRLMRVQAVKRQRGAEPRYKTKVSFFAGTHAVPIPEDLTLGVELFEDAVYVASPCGTKLLEVTPLLRMEHDEKLNEERLFMFRQSQSRKKVVLANDVTGTVAKVLIGTEEGEIPFDGWVRRGVSADAFIRNPLPEGGLARHDHCQEEAGGRLGDRFEILGTLGTGGMAKVFHVVDEFEEAEMALKVLRRELSEDAIFQERFRREAKTMKRLSHEHILGVVDTGLLPDGRLWLTMPVVDGGNLRERLALGQPSRERALGWMRQMLEAVRHLHGCSPPIVHRDIKPSNFLVDKEHRLLLTDFGIALQNEQTRLTRTMEQVGSTAFMSPEQQAGGEVGTASDVYSLGIVFHELMTGEEVVLSPGRGVKGWLGKLIKRMTLSEPSERPGAAEVLECFLAERSVVSKKHGGNGKAEPFDGGLAAGRTEDDGRTGTSDGRPRAVKDMSQELSAGSVVGATNHAREVATASARPSSGPSKRGASFVVFSILGGAILVGLVLWSVRGGKTGAPARAGVEGTQRAAGAKPAGHTAGSVRSSTGGTRSEADTNDRERETTAVSSAVANSKASALPSVGKTAPVSARPDPSAPAPRMGDAPPARKKRPRSPSPIRGAAAAGAPKPSPQPAPKPVPKKTLKAIDAW